MHTLALPAVALLAVAAPAFAQVQMQHLATIDTTPLPIGTNPSAVAWNGTDLFVAGYNGNTVAGPVAIVPVFNALTTPTVGAAFGIESGTPSQRGYTGLDVQGAQLAAAYDNGGSNPNGITCWDLLGTPQWSKVGRGSSGVGFDPGHPTGNPAFGAGVGWTTFGSGRRLLQDRTNGADIWNTANGMVLGTAQTTFWRDMDYDAATGDIWLRTANNVVAGRRTGDNAVTMRVVVDVPDVTTVNQQNLALVDALGGKVVIYNDRSNGGIGQLFTERVLAVRPDGNPDVIDWGTFVAANGVGAYDFSWDQASQTLAISDFGNRKVYVFAVVVPSTYPYGQGCAGQNALVPRLAATGSATPGSGVVVYQIDNAAPFSVAFLAFGFGQTSFPLGNGCNILIDPLLPVYLGPWFTGTGGAGSGTATGSLPIPAGVSGAIVSTQGVVLENADPSVIILSNGVQLIVP